MPSFHATWTAALIFAGVGAFGRAQEVSTLVGAMTTDHGETSYSWQIDFRQDFSRHAAWSVSWINEGHVEGHHRDGWVGQLWARAPLKGDRLTLSLGLGAYRYYDTQLADEGDSSNIHGWAPLFSLSASYYTKSPWFFDLRFNRAAPEKDITINSLNLGVGYRFPPPHRHVVRDTEKPPTYQGLTTDEEFTLYGGKTIVNTRLSGRSLAVSGEYRRGIARHLDWTLSWMDEGDPEVVRRSGATTQVWLSGAYLQERIALSFGMGVYAYADRRRPTYESHYELAGLFSPSIAYRFGSSSCVRLTWHRVTSDYNRDSDVFLLGFGYRWNR